MGGDGDDDYLVPSWAPAAPLLGLPKQRPSRAPAQLVVRWREREIFPRKTLGKMASASEPPIRPGGQSRKHGLHRITLLPFAHTALAEPFEFRVDFAVLTKTRDACRMAKSKWI